ncbi:SOS response-associated peptidase [Alteribacillus bidgolensis]|uniref:Abasic site processing protein n=1 Tax=Alteribacillus bidgolensis TaxID=930129 RepID=A0A1G8F2A1_9BACI|nr:SOS response-associated peptidase [Alteribacillus bidgolensis]SDH76240.1 Putative SOS response-associated peptidase YedK [Alteribacillus bidgolensis]
MCGRYTLVVNLHKIQNHFQVNHAAIKEYEPNYNIAPSQNILAIVNDGQSNRLGPLKWGLIPFWAKNKKIGYKMINARKETLHEKSSFKHALKKRRCIIPADGFYEWKTENGKKQPYRIYLKNEEVFGFAGLWEKWKNKNGGNVFSCTIITAKANDFMRDIHERMPVILTKNNEKEWLNPDKQDPFDAAQLLTPVDSSFMATYKVSAEVNNPKNNHEGLIRPL